LEIIETIFFKVIVKKTMLNALMTNKFIANTIFFWHIGEKEHIFSSLKFDR